MTKLLSAAAVLAALFLTAGLSPAQEKKKAAPAGKVKSVDVKENKITLEGKKKKDGTTGPDRTFDVAKDAKVTVNGETKALADLKAGDAVNLTLSEDQKAVTAISIGKKKKK